ncbi:hypothetical protein ZOSMA_116G00900 [Zostera marina]|uniref:Uncharacterized protein n=1 Tax=Zostera marina TaxID=29655 RepID=A0A0K9Q4B1_ZOSMR|nr:hypothetical protein ZOSMA_116G00900 [Zostera marina]
MQRKQNPEREIDINMYFDYNLKQFYNVPRSWASKMFMTGCVISFPIAITFYIT